MSKNILNLCSFHKSPDFCLANNSWLELDWRNDNNLTFSDFKNYLHYVELLAIKKGTRKIEIKFSANFEKYESFLTKNGYKLSLSELNIDLTDFSSNSKEDTNVKFSLSYLNHSLIKNILIDQANFHHKLLPDYYLSPEKINWALYLHQVLKDSTSKNGLLLLAYKNDELCGLISGMHAGLNANIWEVVVAEKFRGEGLGSYVFQKYIDKLKEFGVKNLTLETIANSYAEKWYIKMSFKKTGYTWFKVL